MDKKTVLVVDDSSTVCTIIKNELTEVGYEVITAKNGIEALSYIEWMEKLPDILTLDIDMPEMCGDELCRLLRQREDMKQVPQFFVSAFDDRDSTLDFFKAGASDYLR
jgi:two-component system, cell cycle response regulator